MKNWISALTLFLIAITINGQTKIYAPAPLTPLNDSINAPATVKLNWGAVTGASYYKVQIDTVLTNKNIHVINSGTTYQLTNLVFGKIYYWRVKSFNKSNDSSSWSKIFNFTVINTVFLTTPVTNASVQQIPVTLNCTAIIGVSAYIFKIDVSPNFDSPDSMSLYNYFQTTTQKAPVTNVVLPNLKYGTTYYWKVMATDSTSQTNWSAVNIFTTIRNITDEPELVYPTNGMLNASPKLKLKWNALENVNYYILQYGKSPTLLNAKNDTVTPASYSLDTLAFGSTYYWRVQGVGDNNISSWSDIYSFTIAAYPALIAPLNGAMGQAISGTLIKWDSLPGVTNYIFRIDTSPDFKDAMGNPSILSNPEITMNNLLNQTTYYWQVRTYEKTDSSSWSPVYSFTTIPLTAPKLTSPANQSVYVSLNPKLTWTTVAGATGYNIELDSNITYSSAQKFSTTTSSYTLPKKSKLMYNTLYYWRVNTNNGKDSSGWSNSFSFLTKDTLPNAPRLFLPLDSSMNQMPNVILLWSKVAGTGMKYILQVDTNSQFTNPMTDTIATNQMNLSNLTFGGIYYWRVQILNNGITTNWSKIYSFTVINGINLISPADNAMNQMPNAVLTWNQITGITGFELQIDTNSNFSTALTESLNTNILNTSGLLFGRTYYWRVKAVNGNDSTDWSGSSAFTVINSPMPVTPSNNSTDESITNLNVSWNNITGILNYQCRIDTSVSFNSSMLRLSNVTDSANIYNRLNFGTKYYWSVRAIGLSNDTSAWSVANSFTTIGTVTILSPANNLTNQMPELMLTIMPIAGATDYDYRIDTTLKFNSNLLLADSTYGVTSLNISGLIFGVHYYLEARARNTYTTSAWSAPITYSTLSSFDLISPANKAVLQMPNVSFTWDNINGAVQYNYEIDITDKFNSESLISNSTTENMIIPDTLRFGTTYYWRVQAQTTADAKINWPWSEVRSFRTIDTVKVISATYPYNNPANITFKWNAITGISSYELQYDSLPTFADGTITDTKQLPTKTSYAVKNLKTDTKYYWRIRAISSVPDTTKWSQINLVVSGINNILSDNSTLEIYPVPAKDKVFIRINNNLQIDNLNVSIYNTLGQEVYAEKINLNNGVNTHGINISDLDNGVYYINLQSGSLRGAHRIVIER